MESKQSSILIQKNIKENTEQLQDFISDLKCWEKEIKEVDNKLSSQSNNKDRRNESSIPPVRSKSQLDPVQSSVKQTQKKKQPTNENNNNNKKPKRMPRDFAAWDKFDFNKALESSEEEDEEEESLSNTKPTIHIPSTNKKERANVLKEEGNKLYSKGRLVDAVAKYTQGMALDPTNPLLSANRAMAYIKLEKYQAAEADCNKCLKLDCNYLKGYLRRATARIHLGKEELARRDCLKVLEMEPGNKEAKRELERLQAKSLGKHEETTKNTAQAHSQDAEERIKTPSDFVKGGEEEGSERKEETPYKGKGKGKRLKIVEVDSSKDKRPTKPNEILPIEKPPHLRSKKPLVKIPVVNVESEEEMNKKTAVKVKEDKRVGCGSEGSQKDKEMRIAKPTKMDECVSSKAFVPSVPRTSHQFTQAWQRLSRKDEAARDYLKMIPSTFFRNVDLEASTMVEVVETLASEGVPITLAAQHLSNISLSHGFSINLMFLEEQQKQVLLSLTSKCKEVESLRAEMEKLESMIKLS